MYVCLLDLFLYQFKYGWGKSVAEVPSGSDGDVP